MTRAWLLAVLAAALLGLVLTQPESAAAAPGDLGYQGPSTVGAGSAPTGSKPESKLWWNDSFWWASMWDAGSGDFHIFRLDTGTQSWSDTGVALDDRASTRADTLWDAASGKLYVASHIYSESPASGYASRLYRFSYNAATDTYTRDAGFPVLINNFRTETLVLAKDSTGQLWATWTQAGKVWVNTSVCNPGCNDAAWNTAFVPSVTGTSVKSDDISSVIAFGGKIGVMWSNQNAAADYFAVHSDSAPDTTWSVETALQGAGLADDHINLKTEASGRLYAVVKTSKSGSADPLVIVLARSTGGSWSSHVFGRKTDHHTRPILELDEANGILHVFATSPESDGVIYEKTSSTSSISFPVGLGTPVLKDADGKVNNATSTKQNVSPSTGLVVLGGSTNSVYFHQFLPLGGGGGTPLTAAFSGTPRSGPAPLNVNFMDQSTGSPSPSSWAWDFQNDGIVDSNAQNPSFQYTSPGTYSVKLTVGNGTSSNSLTQAGYITVSPPGGGGTSVTYTPTDDAYVRSNFPNENTGAAPTLRAFKSLAQTDSFLRFAVGAPAGPVTSATLRLFVTNASPNGGDLFTAESGWSESTITWNMRPSFGTTTLASAGPVAVGTWIELDVTAIVTGQGPYSFVLRGAASPAAFYDSEESTNKPQLVVTTSG